MIGQLFQNVVLIFGIGLNFVSLAEADQLPFTKKEILKFRNDAKGMFYHAYEGYMHHAFPYDELRPLTCDGHDTWGSYSLTLIDALDTLAVMDNKTEFQKVVRLITEHADFEADINVSVFETNIRIIGGLLSGHLLSHRMGIELEEGWPCEGPLLWLATDVAARLLPAFDTATGMPYGTVNLKYGVPEGETPVTCAAGVGTFIMEFGTLSRLTGKPIFENVALRALHSLWQRRSRLNLIGNHIDVTTGLWTGHDAGIGAGVDSFFEYLVKGSFLLQRPELMAIFNEAREAIDRNLRHEDWYLWKSMQRGQVTMAVFQSLEAFWPGVLTLAGDIDSAQKTLFNYHQVLKQYGFTPEFYSIPQAAAYAKRGGYPLRPELIESLMYLYQATKDHTFLKMGADIIKAIEHSAKTDCGYATVENVVDHSLENRMESFFLAETTKYLYLLFHEDHWLHSSGERGRPHLVGKRQCIIDGGGYFYNTEAHPVDAGALACCSGPEIENMFLPPEDLVKLILDPTKLPTGSLLGRPLIKKQNGRKNKDANGSDSETGISSEINKENDENDRVTEAVAEEKTSLDKDVNSVKGEDRNKDSTQLIEEVNENECGQIDRERDNEHQKTNDDVCILSKTHGDEVQDDCKDPIVDTSEIQRVDIENKGSVDVKVSVENYLKMLNEMKERVEMGLTPKKTFTYSFTGEHSKILNEDRYKNEPDKYITFINRIASLLDESDSKHKERSERHDSNSRIVDTPIDSQQIGKNKIYSTESLLESIATILNENSARSNTENVINTREEINKRKEAEKEKLPWDPRFSSLGEASKEEGGLNKDTETEISDVATSVSSSKFTTSGMGESKIIPKELTASSQLQRKVFVLAELEERVALDMAVIKNMTSQVSYEVLSCPVSTFMQSLSFKGQMVNIEP